VRPPDKVRVTTFVAVSPAEAFEVFTAEIDRWWRRGLAYRVGGSGGTLRFEEAGDVRRLVELDDGGYPRHEFGRVLAWEPGARLRFEWRGINFAPDERTEVEVSFEALGDGTKVTPAPRLRALSPDHPVRYGLEGKPH
jgi:uncharacterized protein YndB with AHSA1/START domain